jgi:hypothetical protein
MRSGMIIAGTELIGRHVKKAKGVKYGSTREKDFPGKSGGGI